MTFPLEEGGAGEFCTPPLPPAWECLRGELSSESSKARIAEDTEEQEV